MVERFFLKERVKFWTIFSSRMEATPFHQSLIHGNPWRCDWMLYKERHLVERFFLKLKQFMRVATHYNKLASSFLAFIYLTVIAILLK